MNHGAAFFKDTKGQKTTYIISCVVRSSCLPSSVIACVIFLLIGLLAYQFGDIEIKHLALASIGDTQFYFNCDLHPGEQNHCYPSKTGVTAYETEGKFVKVYDTYSNSSDYEEGKYGKSLSFQAYLGEYVTLPITTNLSLDNFSISFWINEKPWFSSYAPVVSYINANSSAGWIIDLQNNATALRFGVTNKQGQIISPDYVPIEHDNFVNIVGTFDGSSIKVYKDGILFSAANFTGTYDPNPGVNLRLGLNSFNNENSWAGSIDDLRIYNRSVSADDVKLIYYTPSKLLNDLVGYWTFDDSLGDKSGNNHNATLRIQTVGMSFAPDGRMFFTEKRTGEIRIMDNDKVLAEPFAKISELYFGDHEGLLGIALDPKFSTNHFVYVYSTYQDNQTGMPFNRVIRFVDSDNKGTNMTVILDGIPADEGGNYAGGALSFGPDDKLYVTVGMGPSPLDVQNKSSVLGKVLRINRDGTIPSDNPFPNSPIYTLGHRSMYGLAFDNQNNLGIITENGDSSFDEINVLKKGGNYGFPRIQHPSIASAISNDSYISPIRTYERVIAPAQAIFYDGNKFPDLRNKFVFSSYNDGNLHALKIYDNASGQRVNELDIHLPQDTPDNLVGIAQSPEGDLYFSGYNIYRLESINPAARQSMLPIQVNSSGGIAIDGMNVLSNGNSTIVTVTGNATTPATGDRSISMKIPIYTASPISLISSKGCEGPIKTDTIGDGLLMKCTIGTQQISNGTLFSAEIGSYET